MRPSAPFPYTNGWGAALVDPDAGRVAWALERGTARRPAGSCSGAAAGGAAGRRVEQSRPVPRRLIGPSATCCSGSCCGALARVPVGVHPELGGVLFLLSPRARSRRSSARQEVADTTTGRSLLYEETFARTLESPIIGYGAPRPSLTSEITVGTQGALWNTMFCFGFVGLALFAWFLIGGVVRTAAGAQHGRALAARRGRELVRRRGVFYGLDRHMLTICLILGLLLRERYSPVVDVLAVATCPARVAPMRA